MNHTYYKFWFRGWFNKIRVTGEGYCLAKDSADAFDRAEIVAKKQFPALELDSCRPITILRLKKKPKCL